ncbi:MAG: hypothetical protein INR73_03335 [Williamsia sp.]|nr:hypothetical protein [Williamsia sp.]
MEPQTPNLRLIRAYFRYVPLMILLLGAIGFLQKVRTADPAGVYYIAALLAGTLGIIHVLLLYGFFRLDAPASIKPSLFLTGLILTASGVIAVIGNLLLGLSMYFLGYLAAFLIPFLPGLGYVYYLQIPATTHLYWYPPLQQPLNPPPPLDETETELVKFVLSKHAASPVQTSFTLDAPADLPLSQIFVNLINEHNKSNQQQPIEYLGADGELVGWLFFIRKAPLFKKDYIDPLLTLRNNRIPPGRIIYAVRERKQPIS